jgi:hypothetical protein
MNNAPFARHSREAYPPQRRVSGNPADPLTPPKPSSDAVSAILPLRKVQETGPLSLLTGHNPHYADLGHRPQPINQLPGVMLKVPKVVELQFQFAERQPGKP